MRRLPGHSPRFTATRNWIRWSLPWSSSWQTSQGPLRGGWGYVPISPLDDPAGAYGAQDLLSQPGVRWPLLSSVEAGAGVRGAEVDSLPEQFGESFGGEQGDGLGPGMEHGRADHLQALLGVEERALA